MKKQSHYILFPFLLVFYEIGNYLSNDSFIPALPDIALDLLTSNNAAQFTFTIWFLGGLSVQLFLGPLSDRYGRRPVLLIGGIIFIASTLLCTFAPNIFLLLLGRYIQGAAVPSMIIAGYASIHELLDGAEATHALAKMQSVTILAPLLGPLLGSALLLIGNWRWIFGFIAIWSFIGLTMLFFKMPETLPKEKRQPSMHIRNIAGQYYRILTNLHFLKNLLAACFSVSSLIAWMLTGPFLVITFYHYSPIYFGLFQALIFGGFILGMRLVKQLMDKYNRDHITNKALGVSLLGATLTLLLIYYSPNSLYIMIAGLTFVSFCTGLCFPILTRLAIEGSEEPMGARMSMLSVIQFSLVVVTTGIVNIFYNETLLSLAGMTFLFSSIAFAMKFFLHSKKFAKEENAT